MSFNFSKCESNSSGKAANGWTYQLLFPEITLVNVIRTRLTSNRLAWGPHELWNHRSLVAQYTLRGSEFLDKDHFTVQEAKKALAFRSTSVGTDEGLCLGNLLGISPEAIVRAPVEDRMKVIWEPLQTISAGAIF